MTEENKTSDVLNLGENLKFSMGRKAKEAGIPRAREPKAIKNVKSTKIKKGKK